PLRPGAVDVGGRPSGRLGGLEDASPCRAPAGRAAARPAGARLGRPPSEVLRRVAGRRRAPPLAVRTEARPTFFFEAASFVATLKRLREPALLAFKGSLSALVTGGVLLLAAAGLLESPAAQLRLASLLPALTWVII